jgi:hypothetical protein
VVEDGGEDREDYPSILHEAHERYIEEAVETFGERTERFYKPLTDPKNGRSPRSLPR